MPMDYEKQTLDDLIGTGDLTSAICKKQHQQNQITIKAPLPSYRNMVANGQLEVPIGTVLLESEMFICMLRENFNVMKNLPNPLLVLCFFRRNNGIFDVTQGILTSSHL